MVIHSSPGGRKKKKILPKEEVTKSVAPVKVPEKEVVIEETVKVEEIAVPVIEDPTAEEFIATLPKKQTSRKKVTKIIEE